jgi:eukaryotic-like serine/threonine-protein kinase
MRILRPDTLIHTRYQVIQLIGQGGFGAVYEALDQRLGRRVALKQLLHTGDRISHQFEREARLLANLNHPALPRVTDHFSDADGQFLVMDYIVGDDLASALLQRNAPYPLDQVLSWGLLLLDVLHYLHTRPTPIIHRDLKPQNLKLQADGTLMLLDFGLAKGFAGDVSQPSTTSSILAYTKGFAPPEQVEGTGTDARSDLYSLGGTLYCLLTNTAPADAQMRLLAAARQRPDPLRPAHVLNPQVPEAVSWVLLRALALEPEARPPSAEAMRALLERAARPVGRSPARAEDNLTEIDTGASGSTTAPRVPPGVEVPLPRAEVPPIAAQPPRRSTSWLVPAVCGAAVLLAVLALLAVRAMDDGVGAAGTSSDVTDIPAVTATVPSSSLASATAAPSATSLSATASPSLPPTQIAAPTPLPTVRATVPSASATPKAPTITLLHTLSGHNGWLSSIAFAPDSQVLASSSFDSTIKLWRVEDGSLLRTLERHTAWVTSVTFAPDGKTLASASEDQTIMLWQVSDGTLLRTLDGHSDIVTSVAFSPDGQTLASASEDRTIKLWQVSDGTLLRTFTGHTGFVRSVAFSPDGQTVASASDDRTVKLWQVHDGTVLRSLEGHTDTIYSVAFAPDGQVLASGSRDYTVKLWQVSTGELLHTLESHGNAINSVAFSPDSQMLASASYDHTVKLWHAADGALLYTLEGHSGSVFGVAIAPDGHTLASASEDQMVMVWNMQ